MHETIKKIQEYLTEKHNWSKINVAIAVTKFEETHGKKALLALARFITWAKEKGKENIIAITLAHDLNGCEDKLMLPRTSNF